jgi:tyrosine decarboxylase / aspartate 1-decarboxylase
LDEEFAALERAVRELETRFSHLPNAVDSVDWNQAGLILNELARRIGGDLPYHHSLYVGQMLKPPHPIARAAYSLAMRLNPNNHALDGGRATSVMEKGCVAELGRMFGWETSLGHLSSGGTLANFEALWIARELHPGKAVAASTQAHYTHQRLAAVLGVPFHSIASDERGRMDAGDLEAKLKSGEIGVVVATLGTTGLGAVDPLPEIADLCERYRVRLHIDAAYGGYFTLVDNLGPEARTAFDHISRTDSIVVDPHKHGLQPYGCGCVLFRDPNVGRFYRHDSPYTYFTSDELHLGEISLECSRPGASAAALWATMQLLPLTRGGEFARELQAGREAALELHRRLSGDARFTPINGPELDIVVWSVAAKTASESSRLAGEVFTEAARRDLHLAKIRLPGSIAKPRSAIFDWDASDLVCLRACVMKPSHREWMDEIWRRLDAATKAALSST